MATTSVSIAEVSKKYRSGLLTPVEHISNELKKLDDINKTQINGISQFFNKNYVLSKAKESSKRWKNGKQLSEIDGIPITVKDHYANRYKGIPLHNGSLLPSEYYIPQSSAPHIAILIKNGAIPICQTTAPELSFKGTTSTLLHGVTRNPHNLQLTTGGSSGGAAALSSYGVHGIHLGSDGGGSIRIPSSCCGVTGLKPTYPLGFSASGHHFPWLSHVGPISQHVDDCRIYMKILMENISVFNNDGSNTNLIKSDSGKMNKMDFSMEYMKKGINGLKIGVIKTLDGMYVDDIDEKVWKHIVKSCNILKKLGAIIEYVEPVGLSKMDMKYTEIMGILWTLSMLHHYGKFVNDDNKHLVDPFLLLQMAFAKNIKTDQLIDAMNARDKLCEFMNKFINKYDFLIAPTLPILPPKAMEYDKEKIEDHRLLGAYTCLFNCVHFPALSVNCGYDNDSHAPIGMQIIGGLYKDDMVLRAAYTFQQAVKTKLSKL